MQLYSDCMNLAVELPTSRRSQPPTTLWGKTPQNKNRFRDAKKNQNRKNKKQTGKKEQKGKEKRGKAYKCCCNEPVLGLELILVLPSWRGLVAVPSGPRAAAAVRS